MAVVAAAIAANVSAVAPPAQANRATASPQPPPSTTLGSVDFNAYCRSMGDTGARLTGFAAYGWACSAAGTPHAIHVEKACQWQYSLASARADFSSMSDPYSWYCYI